MNTLFRQRMHGCIALIMMSAMCLGGEMLPGAETKDAPSTTSTSTTDSTSLVAAGRQLFLLNCAHCHAQDATGDEGPDLHDVRKSDARIAAMIKNGVKGEMPKFGAKLTDADVRALIAFIRSLN